jgi:hypothetical protein
LAGVMDALVTQAGAFPEVWKIVEEFPLWVWDFHRPIPPFEVSCVFSIVFAVCCL